MGTSNTNAIDSPWKGLYRVGGAAALLAGVVFRRNLGVEVSLFGPQAPASVAGWFALLQENRLLGLTLLSIFDVVDYALVGLMLIALAFALRRRFRSQSRPGNQNCCPHRRPNRRRRPGAWPNRSLCSSPAPPPVSGALPPKSLPGKGTA